MATHNHQQRQNEGIDGRPKKTEIAGQNHGKECNWMNNNKRTCKQTWCWSWYDDAWSFPPHIVDAVWKDRDMGRLFLTEEPHMIHLNYTFWVGKTLIFSFVLAFWAHEKYKWANNCYFCSNKKIDRQNDILFAQKDLLSNFIRVRNNVFVKLTMDLLGNFCVTNRYSFKTSCQSNHGDFPCCCRLCHSILPSLVLLLFCDPHRHSLTSLTWCIVSIQLNSTTGICRNIANDLHPDLELYGATEPNSIGNNSKTTAAAGSIIGIEEREKPQ